MSKFSAAMASLSSQLSSFIATYGKPPYLPIAVAVLVMVLGAVVAVNYFVRASKGTPKRASSRRASTKTTTAVAPPKTPRAVSRLKDTPARSSPKAAEPEPEPAKVPARTPRTPRTRKAA